MLPVPGRIYTVSEINGLTLKDSPFLRVPAPSNLGGAITPIQGDLTSDVISVIGDMRFTYQRTTSEWIPLFLFYDAPKTLSEYLDFELWLDPYAEDISAWVTVKGFPEAQYYSWNDDFTQLHGPLHGLNVDSPAVPNYLLEARLRLANQK